MCKLISKCDSFDVKISFINLFSNIYPWKSSINLILLYKVFLVLNCIILTERNFLFVCAVYKKNSSQVLKFKLYFSNFEIKYLEKYIIDFSVYNIMNIKQRYAHSKSLVLVDIRIYF